MKNVLKAFSLLYIKLENTANIIIYSAAHWAQIRAFKAFHERHRDSDGNRMKQRAKFQKAHEKERIIARVRANQRHNQEVIKPFNSCQRSNGSVYKN